MEVLIPIVFLNAAALLLKTKFNMDSAESYLVALMGAISLLYIGGICNLLFPTAAAMFIGIAVWLIAVAIKARSQKVPFAAAMKLREYATPVVLLNNVFCVVFAVIFSISKPLFYYWDDIAFWGSSAKAVKLLNRLYSVWPTAVHNHLPPSNALLGYFFDFFAADFQPYALLLSYAFLFFAAFSLVAELAYRKSGSLPFAVVTYVMLVLSPFMSVAHRETADYTSLLYAYGTAMIDFNVAVVFLAIAALYISNPKKGWYLLPVVFIVNMKNTGVFFALLAMCVVLCFTLFDTPAKGRILAVAKNGAVILLVIALSYSSWYVHLDLSEPRADEAVILQDLDYLRQREEIVKVDEVIGPNVLSILVPSLRSESYKTVMATMRDDFLTEKSNIFMPDRYFAAVLVAAGVLLTIFAGGSQHLKIFCLTSGIAAGCYVYCAAISYFISYYRDGMIEYPRYMSSYFFLWMYLIVLLVVTGENGISGKQAAFCAVSLAAIVLIAKTGLDYTAFNAPDNPYLEYMESEQYVQQAKACLKANDRVYVVLRDQDTWGYIKYGYHLMPAICNQDTKGSGIDFTISFRESLDPNSDRQYYNVASPEEYAQLMLEYFDYVYVIEPDEEFRESYSQLFSDGMTQGTLYKITELDIPMQVA